MGVLGRRAFSYARGTSAEFKIEVNVNEEIGKRRGGSIAACIHVKYSVGPSIRLICIRCCFTMTDMIQMYSKFH